MLGVVRPGGARYHIPFNGMDLVAEPDCAGLGVGDRRCEDISGFDGDVVGRYGDWRSRNCGESGKGDKGREGRELEQHYDE